MSRGDALRQIAAQFSVLAALEDTIAASLSSVMGPASPGRAAVPPDASTPLAPVVPPAAAVPAAAPSPSHEVAASLLRSASLRASSPRTRTRSRSPAPLPKRAPRAPRPQLQCCFQSCVALSPSRSRDWSRAWPPRVARQSRLPSCVSHVLLGHSRSLRQNLSRLPLPLDPLLLQLLLLRILVLRSPRPTPMTSGTRSLTHTVSLAPRPPSPSRPLPLELVGVLATSVADVSARQPSAPCGEIFNTLSPMSCVFSAGVALLAAGFVLGMRTLPRVFWRCLWTRSFSAVLVQILGLLSRYSGNLVGVWKDRLATLRV